MKWIQSGLGLEQLDADWLRPNERVIRSGHDVAIITEHTVRAAVEEFDDEATIRYLVESTRQ